MSNNKKGKEVSSLKDRQTKLKLKPQEANGGNKVGKADNTVHAKEEKGSMKNSK